MKFSKLSYKKKRNILIILIILTGLVASILKIEYDIVGALPTILLYAPCGTFMGLLVKLGNSRYQNVPVQQYVDIKSASYSDSEGSNSEYVVHNNDVSAIEDRDSSAKRTRPFLKNSFIIILSVALLISISGNIVLWLNIRENHNKISQLNEELEDADGLYHEMFLDYADYIAKAEFMDQNIVFVLEGYGDYYYTYDAMMQITDSSTFYFWAYNVEQARNLGYSPFPLNANA